MLLWLGKMIYDMNEADKNNERAARISVKAANQMYEAKATEKLINEEYNSSMKKVATRKRAVLEKSFPKFKQVYDKITQIQFNQDTRGIKEVFDFTALDQYRVYMGETLSYRPRTLTDDQLLSSVAIFGGQAILLGGGLIAGILGGVAGSIRKESELNVSAASAQRKQASLYAEAVASKEEAISILCKQMENISALLAKLNVLFLKSIKTTEEIINKNGYDSINYTDQELEYIGICMNLAAAIKEILDTPILDENNNVTQAAMNVISTGDTYIQYFNEII